MADTANRHKHTRTARATRRVMVGAICLVVESTKVVRNFSVQKSGFEWNLLDQAAGMFNIHLWGRLLTKYGKTITAIRSLTADKAQSFSISLESKACWTELKKNNQAISIWLDWCYRANKHIKYPTTTTTTTTTTTATATKSNKRQKKNNASVKAPFSFLLLGQPRTLTFGMKDSGKKRLGLREIFNNDDWKNLDVSKNSGTPKWMVYNGKPY